MAQHHEFWAVANTAPQELPDIWEGDRDAAYDHHHSRMYEAVGDDDEVFNNAMEEDSTFMDGFSSV